MLDESPEAIAARLNEAMRTEGVSQTKVADACDVSLQAVGNWLKTGKIAREKIPCLARAIRRSSDWLLTGEESQFSGSTIKPGIAIDALGHEFSAREYSFVPRYTDRPHAGPGGIAQDYEEVEQMLAFRTDWLRAKGLKAENLTANTVRGNSMYPTLKDGDIALTNRADRTITNGKIYTLNLDGRLLIKRLFMQVDGSLKVSSDNKAPEYQDEIYTAGQLDAITINIVGRVVWGAGDL